MRGPGMQTWDSRLPRYATCGPGGQLGVRYALGNTTARRAWLQTQGRSRPRSSQSSPTSRKRAQQSRSGAWEKAGSVDGECTCQCELLHLAKLSGCHERGQRERAVVTEPWKESVQGGVWVTGERCRGWTADVTDVRASTLITARPVWPWSACRWTSCPQRRIRSRGR